MGLLEEYLLGVVTGFAAIIDVTIYRSKLMTDEQWVMVTAHTGFRSGELKIKAFWKT